MFGAAIETIVWSMNVIATAKIIAARTRLRECVAGGVAASMAVRAGTYRFAAGRG
jgi:hypothetical protein